MSSLGIGTAGRRAGSDDTSARHPLAGCPTICSACGGEGLIGGLVVVDLAGNETVEDERCMACGGSGMAPDTGPPLRPVSGANSTNNDNLHLLTSIIFVRPIHAVTEGGCDE